MLTISLDHQSEVPNRCVQSYGILDDKVQRYPPYPSLNLPEKTERNTPPPQVVTFGITWFMFSIDLYFGLFWCDLVVFRGLFILYQFGRPMLPTWILVFVTYTNKACIFRRKTLVLSDIYLYKMIDRDASDTVAKNWLLTNTTGLPQNTFPWNKNYRFQKNDIDKIDTLSNHISTLLA